MRQKQLLAGVSNVVCSCRHAIAERAVNVTEHDYALALETTTVAAGSVALNIRNNGPSAHELLAFRTDLPEDQLPLSRTPASLGGAAG